VESALRDSRQSSHRRRRLTTQATRCQGAFLRQSLAAIGSHRHLTSGGAVYFSCNIAGLIAGEEYENRCDLSRLRCPPKGSIRAGINYGSSRLHLGQDRLAKAEHGENVYPIRFLELSLRNILEFFVRPLESSIVRKDIDSSEGIDGLPSPSTLRWRLRVEVRHTRRSEKNGRVGYAVRPHGSGSRRTASGERRSNSLEC
jgi:hypothetical protein